MDALLTDALAALLEDQCPLRTVREVEDGRPADPLWQTIRDAGFADALVPESAGGAGLPVADLAPLWQLCGRTALPLPLGETMFARALLAREGLPLPDTPVAIGLARTQADGSRRAFGVSAGATAGHVLAGDGTQIRLLSVAQGHTEPCTFELDRSVSWSAEAWAQAPALTQQADLQAIGAMILACQLAGALEAVFKRTLAYANDRVQFGKPIGKFQAIQHQLSVLAEETFAAQMAAQIGCQTTDLAPERLKVAVAKSRASEAALQGAQLAHSIHGAIGFTREFDLQLFTRRLHAWRQTMGSESRWQRELGAALIEGRHAGAAPATGPAMGLTLELLRACTDPVR